MYNKCEERVCVCLCACVCVCVHMHACVHMYMCVSMGRNIHCTVKKSHCESQQSKKYEQAVLSHIDA